MADDFIKIGSSIQSRTDKTQRHQVDLPGRPSKDFILDAPCRIVSVGGRISMSASDLPGETGGIYTWQTDSTKLRLINTTGSKLAITAHDKPGTGRDSEIITVTRTGKDGAKKTKTVALTIAKVAFSASAKQLYGYDDMDTPLIGSDDHVCLKSEGETFVAVAIDGGALGTDFDFVCASSAICTADAAPDKSKFDLRLKASIGQKAETRLQVKVKCPSHDVYASITVHVYTEVVVKVVVAKIANSSAAKTALIFPAADYASHQADANEALKEAVVKFKYRNMEDASIVTNVAYDSNNSGFLDYSINSDSNGDDIGLIRDVMTSGPREVRVAVVRKMRSLYYLERAARKGDTTISVMGENVFHSLMPLGDGATREEVKVIRNTANVGHLDAPLKYDHSIGEPLEFPAAAWSADPIVIAEGADTEDVVKWTILHEVGHRALGLLDVEDPTGIMHANQGNTGHRLRYCPKVVEYDSTKKENQWETIPRPDPAAPVLD